MPAAAAIRALPDVAAAPRAAPSAARRERARRLVVRLVFVIFALGILEGALRKWVAPQLGTVLFFVRDPVLLLAYALATRHGLWPRRSAWLMVCAGLGAMGVLVFLLQAATGGQSEHRLLLGAYGWRNYFLYAPLAFLVGQTFRGPDVQRLFRAVLWLAIPIGVLVGAQFFSSPTAPINVGIADDEAYQFRGLTQNAERTRPMGPFASGAGQNQFVGVAVALLMGYFLTPRRLPRPRLPMLVATGAGAMACLAMGGSRGAMAQAAVVLAASLAVGLLGRGGALKGRAVFWPLAIGAVALVAYPIVFPEGYAAFVERWDTAARTEQRAFTGGIVGRALYGLVDFVEVVDHVPLLGYGLGFGGNASNILGATVDGVKPSLLAETDYSRHMVDLGPVFGLVYLVFRLALAAWLAARALRALRVQRDPMPLVLLAYVGNVIASGQLTGQGTINLFGWLFAGLLIACCNAAPPPRRRVPPPPVRPLPEATS